MIMKLKNQRPGPKGAVESAKKFFYTLSSLKIPEESQLISSFGVVGKRAALPT
jgi:hypothetical protein